MILFGNMKFLFLGCISTAQSFKHSKSIFFALLEFKNHKMDFFQVSCIPRFSPEGFFLCVCLRIGFCSEKPDRSFTILSPGTML